MVISETPFGIRTITYDKDTGISVNGQKIRIQGTVSQPGQPAPVYYNIQNRTYLTIITSATITTTGAWAQPSTTEHKRGSFKYSRGWATMRCAPPTTRPLPNSSN